jgi:hypothetical protein
MKTAHRLTCHMAGLALVTSCLSALAATEPAVKLVEDPCVSPAGFRVAVLDSGRIELNGKPAALSAVGPAFAGLKPETVICLYRDRPDSEAPPPNLQQVIEEIIKLGPDRSTEIYWDRAFRKRVVSEP